MIITLKQLDKRSACKGQRDLFEKLFGASVEITKELCIKHASDFDWTWATKNFLSAPAQVEYGKARASAQVEYSKACASARVEHGKARASAQVEYDKACASAAAEYDKALASAQVEYGKACASAFADAALP